MFKQKPTINKRQFLVYIKKKLYNGKSKDQISPIGKIKTLSEEEIEPSRKAVWVTGIRGEHCPLTLLSGRGDVREGRGEARGKKGKKRKKNTSQGEEKGRDGRKIK